MNDKIKKMSTLIMGAITSLNSSSDEVIKSPEQETDPFASVKVGALNFNIPQYIAAHSSHSSHSSHRSSSGSSSGHSSHSSHSSHRSSSSSGSYTPPTPAPAPTYRTSTPATTNSIRQSDPLGRPKTPTGTYEDKSDHSLSVIRSNKEELKALIMRVQFQLYHNGYYKGVIDGVMGPMTRKALNDYRISKGMELSNTLDVETLNSLGILVH